MDIITDSYLDVESSSMHDANHDTTLIITEDWDIVQTQRQLLSVLNKLVNADTEIFRLTKSGRYNKTGYLLQEAFSALAELEGCISEYQQLHPTVQLFSTVLKASGLTTLPESGDDVINSLLKRFWEEAHSVAHKRQLRNFQRAASKNLAGALSYVDNLFEHHARLLVIRVDLSWQKDMARNKTISADLVRLHRRRLFKRVPSLPMFKHCLGYIWKLEYGQYKGFHYHTCFFFDGSQVRGDITLARRIGEYWKREITGGQGLYFNCNAIASTYPESGIGRIHYTDLEKRKVLQKVISYIAKVDTAVRLSLPEGARTFGRGECIVQIGEKRGRSRSGK
ncbi:inovirus-type Gp2 protein [Citrobacter freundii]|uniref:YagK/YfjJ domain-containing protein n=1 Tax=Enterobacter bugandensis TaxID=881260 RepID=UPI00069ABA8E|nr:inovirus-type Gp2 protein [Enterobacter bugandensis]ELK6069397.1 inovirus-type Gp2 protein [Citrobacter freundii]ELK6556126.1 inovirus-type Gp2 protein [Citrobacter freundii]HEM7537959.1 inovirus-type Gp2 protein [Enterobacter hormaechei]